MEINKVAFPGLGLSFEINRVAFSVFGKDIYWYGIIIAAALICAIAYASFEAKRMKLPEETISDVVLFGVPAAIIGARLYYVIFSWDSYKGDFMKIIAVWEGGLAVYGGIIAGVLTGFIYCRIKKIRFTDIADCVSISFLIGQCIGRWGNFVNVEAYGTQTSLPWRMQIEEAGKTICVHPTFLYESLWNLAGIVLLSKLKKKKPFSGFVFLMYLIWYGIGRTFIEGLRTDSLMLGNLRISQLVSIVIVITSAVIIFVKINKIKNEE